MKNMEARNSTDFFFFFGMKCKQPKMETTLWMNANKPNWIFFLMHNNMHEIHYNEMKLFKQIWTIMIRRKCNDNIYIYFTFLRMEGAETKYANMKYGM